MMKPRQFRYKLPSCHAIEFSLDQRLAVSVGRDVVVHDLHGRAVLSRSHPFSWPYYATFSPTGRRVGAKNTSGAIVVLDPATGTVLTEYAREGEGSNLAFSACGNYLVDGSWDGFVTLREVDSAHICQRVVYENEMIVFVRWASSAQLWILSHQPRTRPGQNWADPPYLTLHRSPVDQTPVSELRIADAIWLDGLDVSQSGKLVAVAYSRRGGAGGIAVYDLHTHQVLHKIESPDLKPRQVAWTPDSSKLASVGRERLVLYSQTLELLKEFDIEEPEWVSFNQSCSMIGIASRKGARIEAFSQ